MKQVTRSAATAARVRSAALTAFSLTISALVAATPVAASGMRLTFAGGPAGGTFQFFANGIATLVSNRLDDVALVSTNSAGSLDNLRRVNARSAAFGVVYAGDLYLGAQGQLADDSRSYTDVRTVAALASAPAQLVVLREAGITAVAQLAGKRVAVGPKGSGAATSARRFFASLGLWRQIRPRFIGYQQGAAALEKGQVDALWVLAAPPNAAVMQLATSHAVALLPIWEAAQTGTLASEHPYYTRFTIPAGTYPGQDEDLDTIADTALWVAGRQVPAALIAHILTEVYSVAGLEFMHGIAQATTAMHHDSALNGVITPLHEGAKRFWGLYGKTVSTAPS